MSWRERTHGPGTVVVERLNGGLTELLGRLDPLDVGPEPEEVDADGQCLDEDVLGGAGRTEFSITDPAAGAPDFCLRQLRAEYAYDQWEFTDEGEYLDFEDPAAYELERIPDRLTPERVVACCRALGIDPFNAQFYGHRAVLIRRPVEPLDRVHRRRLR